MELKRTDYGVKVALTALLATVLAGYAAFAVVYLFVSGDRKVLFGAVGVAGLIFLACVLLELLFIGALGWIFLISMRRTQTLAQRDPAVVSTAHVQPDPAGALLDGQSLSLAYLSTQARVHASVRLLNGCLLAFMMLFMVAWGEVAILAILPVFGRSTFNPLRELFPGSLVSSSPTVPDWLTAAFPLVIALITCLILLLVPQRENARIHQITADDTGITVQTGQRHERIPWDDILLFARMSSDAVSLPFGSYVLWGRSHRLEFSIAGPEAAAMRKSTGALSRGQPYFIFEGGYETYLENAQRLLATIVTRSSTPLLAMREMSLATWLRRRMPVLVIGEETAKALPLASQQYQPQSGDTVAPLHFGEQLTLKLRIPFLPVLGELLALFAVVAVLGFLWGGSGFLQGIQRLSTYPDTAVYPAIFFYMASIALLLITVFPLGATLILALRRSAFPPVNVDGFGISGKSLPGQLSTIPWQNITAWVVIRPPAGCHKPLRYIVYGDGQRLTWAEPENALLAGRGVKGDRRQAYRERAARIHALIATRTGLPLRELRPEMPMAQATSLPQPQT